MGAVNCHLLLTSKLENLQILPRRVENKKLNS